MLDFNSWVVTGMSVRERVDDSKDATVVAEAATMPCFALQVDATVCISVHKYSASLLQPI